MAGRDGAGLGGPGWGWPGLPGWVGAGTVGGAEVEFSTCPPRSAGTTNGALGRSRVAWLMKLCQMAAGSDPPDTPASPRTLISRLSGFFGSSNPSQTEATRSVV